MLRSWCPVAQGACHQVAAWVDQVQKLWALPVQHVVVALYSGDLTLLDSVSGEVRASLSGCGERPTTPTVDPWDGHIWVASHHSLVTVGTSRGKLCRGGRLQIRPSASLLWPATWRDERDFSMISSRCADLICDDSVQPFHVVKALQVQMRLIW